MESNAEGNEVEMPDCNGAQTSDNCNDIDNSNSNSNRNSSSGIEVIDIMDEDDATPSASGTSSTAKPKRGSATKKEKDTSSSSSTTATPASTSMSGVKRSKSATSATPGSELGTSSYVVEDAELLRKIEFNQEKIRKLSQDIINVESYPEFQDNNFDVEAMIATFLSFPTRLISNKEASSAGGAETGAATDIMQIDSTSSEQISNDPDMQFVQDLHMCFRNIIASTIQGSSRSKEYLLDRLRERVSAVRNKIQSQRSSDSSGSADEDREKNYDLTLQYLARLEDKENLLNEIAEVAQKTSYGVTMKGLSDDMAELCMINRWEAISLTLLPQAFANVIKETRNVRGKYKRLIGAIKALIDKLVKTAPTASDFKEKVDDLESKIGKANIEVEKVKEKRREDLLKAEKKAKEDAAKIQKQKEKEEADASKLQKQREVEDSKLQKQREQEETKAKKAQEAKEELEKKLKKQADIEAEKTKEKEKKEKQSSMFKSFFKPAATVASSTAAAPISASKSSKAEASPSVVDSNKYQELDKLFRETMPMSEIIRQFKQRNSNKSPRWKIDKRRLHRRKKLNVTVEIENTDPFAQANSATFSELREVTVDSFMRTLKFHEDLRPAYYGTFSKRSKILNGRKPFHKDPELFNYDVDSEAEWSEEEEGEDIEMSDGGSVDDEDSEEGGKGDEMMYDEFFLQDNDFGSDADSDGEQMTATIMQKASQKWSGVTVAGPRFIRGFALPRAYKAVRQDASKSDKNHISFVPCDGKDDDVLKLAQFVAISHAYSNNVVIPFLGQLAKPKEAGGKESGETPADKEKDAKSAEVEKAEKGFDDTVTKSFIEFVHGKKDNMDKIVDDFYGIYNRPNSGSSIPAAAGGAAAMVASSSSATSSASAITMSSSSSSSSSSTSSERPVIAKDDKEADSDMNNTSGGNSIGGGGISNRIIPKTHIKRRLVELAGKERHPDGYGTSRWVVKNEFIEKFEAKVEDILFTPKVKKQKTKREPGTNSTSKTSSANSSALKSDSKSNALIKGALFQDSGNSGSNVKIPISGGTPNVMDLTDENGKEKEKEAGGTSDDDDDDDDGDDDDDDRNVVPVQLFAP